MDRYSYISGIDATCRALLALHIEDGPRLVDELLTELWNTSKIDNSEYETLIEAWVEA